MKKSKLLFTSLLALLLLSSVSCSEKKSTRSSTSDDTQSTTSPTTPTTGTGTVIDTGSGSGSDNINPDEPGISDGNQTDDYITLANIKVHGRAHFIDDTGYNSSWNTPNPDYMTSPSASVFWSSSSGISSSDQGVFKTNSRFNVRIVPRRAEYGSSVMDWSGKTDNRCFRHSAYEALQLTICVRRQDGGCLYQHTFDANVDSASKVKEFNFPDTAEPLVVEVLNVQSDYNCNSSSNSGYCPYGGHDHPACVKFDIQFSTDQTKDLPGPRY